MYDSVQLSGFDLYCSLTLIHSLYVISVRQTRVLLPSSFRFHLTMDTLDFGCILPTVGRIRDFHPLETCAAGRTINGCQSFHSDSRSLIILQHFFTLSIHCLTCSLQVREKYILGHFLYRGTYRKQSFRQIKHRKDRYSKQ